MKDAEKNKLSAKEKRSLRNRLSAFNVRMKNRAVEMELKEEICKKDELMKKFIDLLMKKLTSE